MEGSFPFPLYMKCTQIHTHIDKKWIFIKVPELSYVISILKYLFVNS